MSFVVLLNGHAASGKTTLAYGLASALNAGLVTTSVLGAFVADRTADDFMALRDRRYHRALNIADEYLQMEVPVVIDGTYALRRWRAGVFSLAQRHEVNAVVLVTCSCSSEIEVAHRFSRRASNPHLPDATARSMEAYYGSLEEIEEVTDQEVPAGIRLGRIRVDSYTSRTQLAAATPLAERIEPVVRRLLVPNRRKAAVAIAFEGIGGSGKSTQSGLLRDRLARQGDGAVHYCGEFSDTALGDWIRDSRGDGLRVQTRLSSGLATDCALLSDWMLQCSRARQAADWIIFDTGCISSVAHMRALRDPTEIPPPAAWNTLLAGIAESTTSLLSQVGRTGITFFLDCSVDVAVARIRARQGRVAVGDEPFLSRLRDAYEMLMSGRGDVIRIDARGDEREVAETIYENVMRIATGH